MANTNAACLVHVGTMGLGMLHAAVQASKVNAALSHEREKGGAAALEAAKAALVKNKGALKALEEQQAAARSSAEGLESDLQKQVIPFGVALPTSSVQGLMAP